MALYAVGDVQGCVESLTRLLERIRFNPAYDRLWFTGDLVNRGPRSADVLRLVAGFGSSANTVLGNHDLHLLAVASGVEYLQQGDSLAHILSVSDSECLLTWLRLQPLFHYDEDVGYALVHAGLLPDWSVAKAAQLAREVESVIRGPRSAEFFRHMYADFPDRWDDDLTGWDRLRMVVNGLTRIRFCYPDGRMDYEYKGSPANVGSSQLLPWFKIPFRHSRGERIVFGHWSLLGLWNENGLIGLDTGCVWGGYLTAARLQPGPVEFFRVPCGTSGVGEV